MVINGILGKTATINTSDSATELFVVVQCSRDTGQLGRVVTASLDKPLACRHLTPQRGAFWTIGIVVDRIWPFTEIFGDASHLNIIVRHAISNNDRGEVDLLQMRGRC